MYMYVDLFFNNGGNMQKLIIFLIFILIMIQIFMLLAIMNITSEPRNIHYKTAPITQLEIIKEYNDEY